MARFLALLLLSCPPAFAGQVTDLPLETQGPGPGSALPGSGMGGSGSSAQTGAPSAGADLKGSVSGSQRPEVSGAAASASEVPSLTPEARFGLPEIGVGGERSAPERRTRLESAETPLLKHGIVPDSPAQDWRKPSAARDIGSAATRIEKGRAAEGSGSDLAVHKTLQEVFDAHRPSAGSERGAAPGVAGAYLQTEGRIRRTVALADRSSPRDAPGLLSSAVELGRKTLAPAAARAVESAVLAHADAIAPAALRKLLAEPRTASSSASPDAVRDVVRALDAWDSLLGIKDASGRLTAHYISDLELLKSYVARSLAASAKGLPGAGLGTAPGSSVWFEREGGRLKPVLPRSSIELVRADLPQSLALGSAPGGAAPAWEEDIYESFSRDPSPSHGYRLILGLYSRSGASWLAGHWAAGVYWLRASGAGLLRVLSSPREIPSQALLQENAAVDALLASRAGRWDVRAGRSLIAQADRAARRHRELTGDPSVPAGIASLSRRFETEVSGLSESDLVPPATLALLVSPRGNSVSRWVGRAVEKSPSEPAAASPSGTEDRALAGAPARIERLLSDVRRRAADSVRFGAAVQAAEPGLARFQVIGRAGAFEVRAARRLKGGRWLDVTALADPESGNVAYARAEWVDAPARSVPAHVLALP